MSTVPCRGGDVSLLPIALPGQMLFAFIATAALLLDHARRQRRSAADNRYDGVVAMAAEIDWS